MEKTRRRGFTLIELLVVVAIIGMLASVVLASLSSARAKGRDARRFADLKQFQLALELYYSDNNQYPASPSNTQVDSVAGISPGYISSLPADPTLAGQEGYRYCASTSGQSYVLLAHLESNSDWCSMPLILPGENPCSWLTYSQCQ